MGTPRVLQIRPTTSCPARCATCTTLVERGASEMSLDDIDRNLAFFRERHQVDELVFSGAEITQRADFREVLERVGRYRFRLVTLISSGLLWSETLAHACAGVIDRVVVALTPASAAEWRSPLGRFARVRRSVDQLTGAGLRVQSNTVLLRGSIEVLDEIADAIEAWDIGEPIFLFPFGTGGAAAVERAGVPTWTTVEPRVRQVLEMLESRRPRLKNVPPCLLGSLSRFATKTTQRFLVQHERQLEDHALIPPFVGMTFAPLCTTCPLRPRCDGYWPAHVDAEVMAPPRRTLG